MNRRQEPCPLQMNRRQGLRSFASEYQVAGTAFPYAVSEPQFLIFHNEMLTIETAVSSAKFVKQPFSQALGVVPHVFYQDSVHLNFTGTTSLKQGQQFLYKLMAQDRDRSPLQMNTTGQGRSPLQMNTKCWDSSPICL